MSPYVFLNGSFFPEKKALIHFTDLALHRGFAIFDFFRTQNGLPFMLDDHLDRFERSATILNLSIPYSRTAIETYVDELIQCHDYKMAGIKLILTGGEAIDGLTPTKSNFFMNILPITFPEEELYRTGARLLTAEYRRDIPEVKTVNYAKVISMRDQLAKAEAVDVLFTFQGEVYETSRSNFFVVEGDIIRTPASDVLQGITRKTVMRLANDAGYQIEAGPISLESAYKADEAFITGTTKKIMPVVDLDGTKIGNGLPGQKTEHLKSLFAEFERNWNAVTRA